MATTESTPRVWFVTGATSGIGRELVRQALEVGEPVAAIARNTASLADLGPRDLLLAADADVRDEAAVRKTANEAAAKFGRIDVVANNAGYGLFGAVEESTDAQARAIFDTNVFGVLNVLRATLPVMRAQRSGHILQGSSYYGQSADPGVGLLAATKYAVEGLSDSLAAEVAPLGIKVTIVEPGALRTDWGGSSMRMLPVSPDYEPTVGEMHRYRRAADGQQPGDPARAARIITEIARLDQPPLRLLIGSDALRIAGESARARAAEAAEWAAVSRSADFA